MRILVTGANGQLGSEMRLLAKHSNHDFIFTDVNQVEGQETVFLDITDRQAVMQMVQSQGIQAIVNCAAWTNVDACETDPALATLAHKLNALAPENLALAMKAADGLLIHISTDYVFGTEAYNTPCREDQQGTPTGVYGQTKKEGEERILATECKHVIIRTAWLYSEFGKNFCRTMLQLTAERPTLQVVYDQCGTPTYALDLAKAICTVLEDYGQTENGKRKTENCSVQTENSAHSLTAEGVDKNANERLKAAEQRLIATGSQVNVAEQRLKDTQSQGDDSPATPLRLTSSSAAINRSKAAHHSPLTATPYPKSGIYHYSNQGVCSWYDFTQMIQHIANTLTTEQRHCDIRPCRSSQYPSPVKRPSYSVLDKTKIQETFGVEVPYWTDSLRQCITNLLKTENGKRETEN